MKGAHVSIAGATAQVCLMEGSKMPVLCSVGGKTEPSCFEEAWFRATLDTPQNLESGRR